MQQDPFYLTFGKQNWNTLQVRQSNNQSSTPNTNTNTYTNHKQKLQNQTKVHTLQQQIQTPKKKPIIYEDIYKQNNFLNDQTVHKNQRRYSTVDRNKRHPHNLMTIREQIVKQQLNHPTTNLSSKNHVSFDLGLNKKFRDVETAPINNIDKYKITTYNRPAQSIYESYAGKDKYRLLKAETGRKQKIPQPTLNKYKEQINKIDSLINRINQRITSSHLKFC